MHDRTIKLSPAQERALCGLGGVPATFLVLARLGLSESRGGFWHRTEAGDRIRAEIEPRVRREVSRAR
jgi:hypothetical protein